MKEYLYNNWIDISKFEIEEYDLKDILLFRKNFRQGVTFQVGQKDMDLEDDLSEKKQEIPRITRFKPEDYDLGEHTINSIEPGTFKVDDCITCDGHWERSCLNCSGTGDEKCSKCKGGTKIIERTILKKEEGPCVKCKGAGSQSSKCRACAGKGNILKKIACNSCQRQWKIQTPQGIKPCTICRASWYIAQNLPCGLCNGAGITTLKCGTCGWLWKSMISRNHIEKDIKKCSHCNGTSRRVCSKCKGIGSLTCNTCEGKRRTIQYEYNTFTISVTPCYELLEKKFPVGAIESIALAPQKALTALYPGEKEKLKTYLLEYKLKLSNKIASRIKGKLYILKDKLDNSYYIYESNNNYYCSKKPPTSDLESYKDYYVWKIKLFFSKYISKLWRKIENFITGKNEY